MMIKGQGCYLWDMENRRYLDLTAGIAVNSLGHCDREIAQIIAEQVRIIRPIGLLRYVTDSGMSSPRR